MTCCSIGCATRLLDHLGARARIAPGDLDLRRHDVGVLRERDREDRDQAGERDHDRDDEREPRPLDEDVGDHGSAFRWLARALGGGRAAGCASVAATIMPGRTFWMPSTITRSPSFRPSRPPPARPRHRRASTRLRLHLVVAADHQHVGAGLVDLERRPAAPRALLGLPRSTLTPTNWPSTRMRSGLGSSARTVTVSVPGSTWTSRKFSVPGCS